MRYLLALLIFFLTTIDVFGWTLSLAPGLSVKNAILYLILLTLSARFVVRGGLRLELPQLHLWFAVLIAYATLSWLIVGVLVQYKSYTLLGSGIDLKAKLLDNAIVFAMYLYGTRTLQDAKFLLKCMLLAVTAANAIAIGNVAGLFEIGITPVGTEGNLTGRVFGAFGHANETAALTVCLLPAYVAAASLLARHGTGVLGFGGLGLGNSDDHDGIARRLRGPRPGGRLRLLPLPSHHLLAARRHSGRDPRSGRRPGARAGERQVRRHSHRTCHGVDPQSRHEQRRAPVHLAADPGQDDGQPGDTDHRLWVGCVRRDGVLL